MSYSISVSGHKNHESAEEGKKFEEEVVEKAKEFVASIEGVTNALFSGSTGVHNLREE